MTKTFDMIMRGLGEVEEYLDGEREGYAVHIPDEVDVKAIRQKLHLSQPNSPQRSVFPWAGSGTGSRSAFRSTRPRA